MKPLHWSALRHMRESPAHYKHALDHGVPVTSAMRFSQVVHAALFGPSPYGTPVVWDGNKVKERKRWAEFKEAHAGQEIVTVNEVDWAADVAAAVRNHPVAGPLVSHGKMEQTVGWKVGGRDCEGTPDNVMDETVVDLKLTDPNPERFVYQVRRMGWYGQAAFYLTGTFLEQAKIIAVSPKPPYTPVVYSLTPETIQAGHKLWRGLLERLIVCEASDEYPGYVQTEVPLELPDAGIELEINGETVRM